MSVTIETSQQGERGEHSSLLKRHPLATYFVMAFAFTWLTVVPVMLSSNGFGLLPFAIPFAPFQLLGSFTGPALSALIVTAVTSGRTGLWQLLRRFVQWRVGLQWYLLALFGFPALYLLVASVLLGTAPLSAFVQKWPLLFTFYLPTLVTVNLVGPLGEETGWRGFALPRLQQQYGAFRASLTLGLLWALWHLPLYIILASGGGLGPFNPAIFVINTLQIMIITILITWVFNNAKGSLLITILLHSASNTAGAYIAKLIPVFPPLSGLVAFALFIACTLLVLVFTRGRLSYRPGRPAQSASISPAADLPMTQV